MAQVYTEVLMDYGDIKAVTVVGVNRLNTIKTTFQTIWCYATTHHLDKGTAIRYIEPDYRKLV
jgi:hypothetical protein